MRARRGRREVPFLKAVLLIGLLSISPFIHAEVPPPWWHASFDDGYGIEGKLTSVKCKVPFDKIPKERIVKGVRGSGIMTVDNIGFSDKKLIPAPAGTISYWLKPVGWGPEWGDGKGKGSSVNFGFGKGTAGFSLSEIHTYFHEIWPGVQFTWPTGSFGKWYRRVWKDDCWLMLTLTYRAGERTIYINDYYAAKTEGRENNPEVPGSHLQITKGGKVIDSITVWDEPLDAGQVGMLFWSERPETKRPPAYCLVPPTGKRAKIDGRAERSAWQGAASFADWCDSFAGSSVPARDLVNLTYNNDTLYVLYREPMPQNYEILKVNLGGSVTSKRVTDNDGPVWQDDAVELRLSPDDGRTVYRLIYNAAGARYDSRNGDKTFTSRAWKAAAYESPKYWAVEFAVPLDALAGKDGVKKWGFNIVRYVRKQGYAKRQWCYLPGDVNSFGQIVLGEGVSPEIGLKKEWLPGSGQLTLSASGKVEKSVMLDYNLTPLVHQKLLPDYDVLNKCIKDDFGTDFPEPVSGVTDISKKSEEITYAERRAALLIVALSDAGGKKQYAHSSLLAAKSVMAMTIINLPTKDMMVAQLALPSKKMLRESVSAVVTLAAKKSDSIYATKKIDRFNKIMEEAVFDVKGLAFGPIQFRAEVFSKGEKIGEVTRDFYLSGKPVWWGKDVGVLKSVPPPWKPVVVGTDSAEVLLKKYTFDGGLLPSQIKAAGQDLLAAPMRLVIKAGGKTIDTRDGALALTEGPGGMKALLHGEKTAGSIKIALDGFVEFDGFIWNDITITPRAEVKFDEIYLEVPTKKEFAKLFNGCYHNLIPEHPNAVPDKGLEAAGNWCIRIGTVERGIQISPFYRYPEEKLPVKDPKPIKIKPSGDAMVLTYTLLDTPVSRTKPIKIELGIFGMPVKPFDRTQRRKFHGASGNYFPRTDKVKDRGYVLPYYFGAGWTGHPPGSSEDRYINLSRKNLEGLGAKMLKQWKEHNWFTCLYTAPTSYDAASREYAYFQDEWRMVPGQPHLDLTEYLDDLKGFEGLDATPAQTKFANGVCYASRGATDYFMYCLEKAERVFHDYGMAVGVYVDTTGHYECANPYHGHGYVDDEGVRRTKQPFLEQREWAKRLHGVMKGIDPDALIVIHMSNNRSMGMWSLADVIVEGEQFSAAWKGYMAQHPELTMNDCFPTILPLDRFRATFAKGLTGLDAGYLSQMWEDKRQKEVEFFKKHGYKKMPPSRQRRDRHLCGLTWVHDTPIWGEIIPVDVWCRLAEWGWDESVEFVGYWDTKGKFTLDTGGVKNIVASVWYRPDGKLVAIVFNDTDNAARAALKIHRDRFPVTLKNFSRAIDISSPDEVLDEGKKESDTFPVQDYSVTVDLRPRDYRFLMFEE